MYLKTAHESVLVLELYFEKCTLRLRSVSVIMQLLGYFTKLGFGDFANEAGASRPSATGIVLSDLLECSECRISQWIAQKQVPAFRHSLIAQ